MSETNATEIGLRAAEFLQRRRFWQWTETEQAQLDAWLSQSLAHRVAFVRLEAGQGRTERIAALQIPQQPRSFLRGYAALAGKATIAVVLCAALTAGGFYFSQPKYRSFQTPVGGREIVTLGDGSKIELNTNTVVRTDVSADHRAALLEKGEAYFQIAHDVGHPFVVTAQGHRITVLGTKFSVRADARETKVTLFEGRVWFTAKDSGAASQSAMLLPGDSVIATADKMSVIKNTSRELSRDLGWRRGVLVFGNTSLTEAAAEFNRYNTQQIVIADRETGALRVGGTFPATSAEDFTHLVRSVLGLRVQKRGQQTIISRQEN
ncbi:MAG TPA: FecR domain-containing protein [Rhizomicrobium sp.]|jgi:transmembrane sensor